MTTIFILLTIIIAIAILAVPPIMRRYWQEETNMSEDDYAFDRDVASYNSHVANQRSDEDIRDILSGRSIPTVADRYRRDDDDDR